MEDRRTAFRGFGGLLTHYSIRGVTLRNRFLLPAMQRGWCDNGRPTPLMADYYRRRAAGGVGIIIGESAAVDHPSATGEAATRRFWDPEWPPSPLGLAGWTKSFTDAAVIAVGSVGLSCDTMDSYLGGQQAAFDADRLGELVERFDNGEFDLVAVGRSLIGDPDWIGKVAEGRFDAVRSFTNQDLFAQVAEWDIGFVADAHGLKQGEGVLDFGRN